MGLPAARPKPRHQRYTPSARVDEDALTVAIVALASHYGRYGYRRVTALLNQAGFKVGKDRVQRIWRREGLKTHRVPISPVDFGIFWLRTRTMLAQVA